MIGNTQKKIEVAPGLVRLLTGAYFVGAMLLYALSNNSGILAKMLGCRFQDQSGLPCPGCGGLRAAYLFISGSWLTSFQMHPMVFLLSLLFLWGFLYSFWLEHKGQLFSFRAQSAIIGCLSFGIIWAILWYQKVWQS